MKWGIYPFIITRLLTYVAFSVDLRGYYIVDVWLTLKVKNYKLHVVLIKKASYLFASHTTT